MRFLDKVFDAFNKKIKLPLIDLTNVGKSKHKISHLIFSEKV